MNCLIGYTGFVGGNLYDQRSYDLPINSKNFQELRGRNFDRIFCAGVSAVKWKANKDPEGDWANISALIDVLKTVRAEKFVLISTIDVYPAVRELDESFDCHSLPNHAYGTNRLKFEDFCREHFPNCMIVRLPGLFGNRLKKNVIYDLLHDNCLEMINPASSFQYYCLDNLSDDIERCEKNGLELINLFTEPIGTWEILKRFFPEKEVGSKPSPEVHYDLTTSHADIFGKKQGYVYSKAEVLTQLAAFIERERHA